MLHPQGSVPVMCVVASPPPPPPMYMYGLRDARNGRFWVTFFVTKYCDLFCDRRGVGGGLAGPPPPVWPLAQPRSLAPLPNLLLLLQPKIWVQHSPSQAVHLQHHHSLSPAPQSRQHQRISSPCSSCLSPQVHSLPALWTFPKLVLPLFGLKSSTS